MTSRLVAVVDHRRKKSKGPPTQYKFNLGSDDLSDLMAKLQEKLGSQDFVLTFPDRTPVDRTSFSDVTNGTTLWLLSDFDQKLRKTVGTPVLCQPHYHTITQSGMYEYYDSRGIDSLVISLAELIDNSLAATKANIGVRYIEIRFYDNGSDSMLVILDNGHGMDFNGLHDWARFKYSKFERKKKRQSSSDVSSTFADSGNFSFSSDDLPLRGSSSQPQDHIPDPRDRCPRYLDSEINYFGAGGKQAIFNIGEFTTMISKTVKSEDIVELTLSTKKFAEKAQIDQESVYRDEILTRSRGVKRESAQNSTTSELILNEVIAEMERTYKSFTICAIKDVFAKHIPQFKKNNENNSYWTKGLARIYHYYLHGPKGNIRGSKPPLPSDLKDIGISMKVLNVRQSNNGGIETPTKHSINLKDINDDFETLLVRSAADTFEFEVEHLSKAGVVIEGIVRYYPYLYDRETLPLMTADEELGETASHVSAQTSATENQIEEVLNPSSPKAKPREVFECFWHGRLIPQDCIDFEWCKFAPNKDNIKGYEECYTRLSGALFTNHAFQVSQNKQSFMDLNKLMAQKDHLTFYRVDESGNRRPFRKEFVTDFINWIKNCHNLYDKQVLYKEYIEDVHRNSIPALKKNSFTGTYSVFEAINWRDKEWKKGKVIQTKNTKPQGLIGRINRFLVPKCNRDISGNFMGCPGFVEIYQIPEEVYGKGEDASKIITFKQINVDATDGLINKELEQILEKLPHKIDIDFPKGHPIKHGDKIMAGETIGDIQISLKNIKGDKLTTDRIPFKSSNKKILVQTEIVRVLDDGDTEEEVVYDLCSFSREWDYWYLKKEDGIKRAGKYRLLSVCLAYNVIGAIKTKEVEGNFANGTPLPELEPIEFTVVAAPPEFFSIKAQHLYCLIGNPFDLSLEFTDVFENQTKPDNSVGLPVLKIGEGFDVTFDKFETLEDRAVIKNIVICGPINENQVLKVSMPALNKTKEIGITLQKGKPSRIRLLSTKLEFINGEVPELGLLLFDRGGNEVTFDKQYSVFCQIIEANIAVPLTDLQLVENMHNGKRSLVINKEIVVKRTDTPFNSRKFSIRFYTKTLPEVVLEKPLIIKKNCKPSYIKLYFTNILGDNEEIEIPNGGHRQFPANSHLAGIHFKAYDCDDSQIDLNDFENHTVSISWYNKPFLITSEGSLPNIHVHTSCSEERLLTFSWKQAKKDINVEYSFYLRPYPDSAQRMAINKDSHTCLFPLGATMPQSLQVSVLDAYNNTIRTDDIKERLVITPVTQKLIIDGKSLKKTIPRLDNNALQNSISFVISNIRLLPNASLTQNDSVIGETKLQFSIQGMDEIIETIDIKVVNGDPSSLKWLSTHKCLTLMNNRRLEIRCQLCDQFNNPIKNKENITLLLGPDFLPNELLAETDGNGEALFSETIHINQKIKPNRCVIPSELERDFHQTCSLNCFGFHKIQAIVKFKNKVIKSCYYWLHITCDNKNPVRIDYRLHGTPDVISMSTEMPTFTVRLFAEDNSLIYNFDANKIEMQLINIKDNNFQVFPPVPPFKAETFKFRVDRAPLPNTYKVKFVCYGVQMIEKLVTPREYLKIVPDVPVKLLARGQALKNWSIVTNVGRGRQILESSLTLDLVDRKDISIYENIPDSELDRNPLYSGALIVTIINNFGDSDERIPVPQLESCDENMSLRFPIRRGRIELRDDRLRLRENTQGVSNTRYIVEMRAYFENDMLDRRYNIEPFHMKIMFCDDTARQEQLSQIQNNISIHQNKRENIEKELKDKNQEVKQQRKKFLRIRDREKELIENLNIKCNERSDLSDANKITKLMNEYHHKLNVLNDKQSERTFRGLQISSAPQKEGVIGKIANLAFIQDEAVARSASWFLKNHMNCTVVTTEQIAEELSEDGTNAILSLELIPNRLTIIYERLPHDCPTGFKVCNAKEGWLRAQLRLNENLAERKDLEKIFKSLLSETIYMIDIQKARWYRKNFERTIGNRNCPTIVTKNGILYDNGIVEMIPKDDNFVCFQSPPEKDFIRVQKAFEYLTDLLSVHKERVEEYKITERLEDEYRRFAQQRDPQIVDLDKSIREEKAKFADISATPLELLNEDSNQSNHSSYDRRRRRSNNSGSRSPERKRSRH